MRFYCFEFKLFDFRIDTDGIFVFKIGEWETADYDGCFFLAYRDYDGDWIFEFLCARTLINIYRDWKEK